jgi:hypothetical protein
MLVYVTPTLDPSSHVNNIHVHVNAVHTHVYTCTCMYVLHRYQVITGTLLDVIKMSHEHVCETTEDDFYQVARSFMCD